MGSWHFPLLGGGEPQGIHNPGIEMFRPFLESLVRELGQNTSDAPDGSGHPVLLQFLREDYSPEQIPGLAELRERLVMCRKFYDDPDPNRRDQDALDFFDNALRLIAKKSVSCLRVSDYNTTGVSGDDNDRFSGWYKLAKSSGSTGKPVTSGAGGSFGIGKLAATGASQFRTVYLSTLSADGQHNFIGSSLLTAHADAKGTQYQHRWYFGNPVGGTVHDKTDIPKMFLRRSVGLDTFVTAFDFSEEWEDEIAVAVLNNFWPAILWGKFECIVGQGKNEIIINKESLPGLLVRFSDKGNALLYYRAYTSGTKCDASPKKLKECSAYVIEGENLPKKFAMIRRNGMIIEERIFHSRLPVAGVFECVNETGNSLLRAMEPPRHNMWNPDLANEGHKIEQEFKRVIYDAIKKINSVSGETGSVTGLENLLPFDEQINDTGSSRRQPTDELAETPKQTTSLSIASNSVVTKRKKRKKRNVRSHIPIIPRAIKTGSGRYTLKIEHEGSTSDAYISIGIAGDRTSSKTKIISVEDDAGRVIAVNDNVFGPIGLNSANSFDIKLAVKRRVSLEVSAYHEA